MKSFKTVENPLIAAHVEALQRVSEACWSQRSMLLTSAVHGAFLTISGDVFQVDVDKCAAACFTRGGKKFFVKLLGEDAHKLLVLCQSAYDAFFTETLEPTAQALFANERIHRMPGRKLLLSGLPGRSQLLHLDSLFPTLVGNVYLRPRGFEHVPIEATIFPLEPRISAAMNHPRDLTSPATLLELDDVLGCNSVPWGKRADDGPRHVTHNSAVLFYGNIVHGGPAPDEVLEAEPRIVMFQSVRPGSSADVDLSDYQEFEFSLFNRLYGDTPQTRRAVRDTMGRWREHFAVDCDTSRAFEKMDLPLCRRPHPTPIRSPIPPPSGLSPPPPHPA